MANISQKVTIDMLEKLEDGTFQHKLPSTNIKSIKDLRLNDDKELEFYNEEEWVAANWSDGDDQTGSPGPKGLVAGDLQAGYFGIVSSFDLFTGQELADAVGLTEGSSQFDHAGFLKFAIDGKIIYKSKKPFRHSISWDHIDSKGCVSGTKEITKNGITYKVRLMKTGTEDPMSSSSGSALFGSEWNRLMYPIHEHAETDSGWFTDENVDKPTSNWGVNFTDEDLGVVTIDGRYHWCQEVGEGMSERLVRGNAGVSVSNYYSSSSAVKVIGWSPVLEVIE